MTIVGKNERLIYCDENGQLLWMQACASECVGRQPIVDTKFTYKLQRDRE